LAVNQPGTPREEWDQDEKESLGESVRYLCSQEILHQGHEWHCSRCSVLREPYRVATFEKSAPRPSAIVGCAIIALRKPV
jgi:hypothetical protein